VFVANINTSEKLYGVKMNYLPIYKTKLNGASPATLVLFKAKYLYQSTR
jgi:hypothetical protein